MRSRLLLPELIPLALGGLVIATAGALLPAGLGSFSRLSRGPR